MNLEVAAAQGLTVKTRLYDNNALFVLKKSTAPRAQFTPDALKNLAIDIKDSEIELLKNPRGRMVRDIKAIAEWYETTEPHIRRLLGEFKKKGKKNYFDRRKCVLISKR